jgi:rhodanese-related sulfurtransferase
MVPIAEILDLPPAYGNPSKPLKWKAVQEQLEKAPNYWFASVRRSGRPHVVPRDGVWVDDACYYGGSPATVHSRIIQHNPSVTMHIGDGISAVIVEGRVTRVKPDRRLAEVLAKGAEKYKHYGYNMSAEQYMALEISALRADKILAWTNLPENATRFRFERAPVRMPPNEEGLEVTEGAVVPRIEQLLVDARLQLPHRPTAEELPAYRARGAVIVDIRPVEQRVRDGEIPGSIVIDRNVLEWRLDPTSPHRIPEIAGNDQEIVLVCNEGFQSSLAAHTLQRLGLKGATDLAGGMQGMKRLH